ncbi:lysozyme inhibitor LprI family protein [Pseudomonas sp. R4-76]|uniref:lysozyme inhibitor LprI family protein n=1 Tax=unclassified Pseudomonas TaxID=196821 RepID=UPI003DA8F05C
MKVFSILLGCLISAASSALFAGEACNPDSFSNPDLIICGQQTFKKVDGVLNEQYKKALSTLAPAEQSRLRDVQKNWVRFKESFCEELYQAALPGAEAPFERLGCLVQTTNARLGELIALQTGLPLDGFYKAASAIAGKDRERDVTNSIGLLGGEELYDPLWTQYAEGHCKMSERLFREDFANCRVRMRFQLPMNR